jgi:hypothetical protein
MTLFVPAAFFIFLAAPTGAWIIPAYFGFNADHRLFCWIGGINEIPRTILLSEETEFLVILNALVRFKRGSKGDRANLIVYAAL